MNVVDIEIKAIRPDPASNKMLGNVTFYIRGGIGGRCDIMNFECHCNIAVCKNSNERLSQIKRDLKANALQQAKRMPEFCSGKDVLVLLTPRDQQAA